MDFEDQKITAIRNEEKKKKYSNLDTGIYVGDQLYKFSKRKLYDEKISLLLPTDFFEMSQEDAKRKYPSEQRPQIILTDISGMANFTFNFLQEQIASALLEGALLEFRMLIQRVHPSNEFLDSGEIQAKNVVIHWFDFISAGFDYSVYNLMWVTSIEGRLLLGMFNVPINICQSWKQVNMQILETFSDLTIGGNENAGTENTYHTI